MSISFHDASVGTYSQILTSLAGCMEKGAAFANETGLPLADIVSHRLHEEMMPFHFQVVSLCHHSWGALQGMRDGRFSPPSFALDKSYSELQELVSEALAGVNSISADEAEEIAAKSMVFALGERELPFTNENFLLSFSLPNFYFHATTTYDILRILGAPLGKMDEGNAHRGFDIHMSGGRPEIHIIHNWPSNAIKVTSKKKFEPNQWHHVFVTYNGTSQQDGIKIYVDGQVTKHDVQHNSLSKSIKTKRPLRIGRRFSASQFSGAVDEVRIYNRELTSTEVAAIAGRDPIKPILATQFDKRTDAQKKQLLEYYLQRVDKQYSGLQKQQTQIEKRVSDLGKPLSSVMVMKDVPKPRMTFILDRGDYASPDKKSPVEPGTPSILPPLPEGAPANRLGMARWLVSDEHPLTARVTVNRFWQMFFGVGLVETVEDFGSQGKSPTNQAILDWLAADFVQSGWDVKRLLKSIAMSSTYRQSSRTTRDRFLADPENLYYSRGPRFRLTGESIRDNALSAAGILVAPIGGAGVKPTQPAGLWNEVSVNTGLRFRPDSGSKLYRRSMYTYWKRSAPQPTLNILGTPSREKCVVRRAKTNTPLQALVTMNDPHFVEAARVMAERMLKVDGDLDAKIELAFRTLCGVRPDSRAKTILKQAYEEELALFKKDKVRAEKLLGIGAYKRDKSLDLFEHAAMTSVCSIIMNLEQCLTRG